MTVIDRQKAFSVVGPGFPSLSWSLISMAIYGMYGLHLFCVHAIMHALYVPVAHASILLKSYGKSPGNRKT